MTTTVTEMVPEIELEYDNKTEVRLPNWGIRVWRAEFRFSVTQPSKRRKKVSMQRWVVSWQKRGRDGAIQLMPLERRFFLRKYDAMEMASALQVMAVLRFGSEAKPKIEVHKETMDLRRCDEGPAREWLWTYDRNQCCPCFWRHAGTCAEIHQELFKGDTPPLA